MDYRVRMRAVREDHDYTQAEIGRLLHKSQHIETGRAELKIDDLKVLCRFYDVSADYMIGLSDAARPFYFAAMDFSVSRTVCSV